MRYTEERDEWLCHGEAPEDAFCWAEFGEDEGSPDNINFEKEVPCVVDGAEYLISESGKATLCAYKGTATEFYIPSTITVDGKEFKIKKIKGDAFSVNKNLTKVVIPDNVTEINMYAFAGCTNLTDVVMSRCVRRIGVGAFCECVNLKQIFIPKSVYHMGEEVFENCRNLTIFAEAECEFKGWDCTWNISNRPVLWDVAKPITIDDMEFDIHYYGMAKLLSYQGTATELNIPSSIMVGDTKYVVALIGANPSKVNNSLVKVTIPASVMYIWSNAFSYYNNISSIEVDNNNKRYMSIDGNVYLKEGVAFAHYAIGKKDDIFTIQHGVTDIWSYACCNSHLTKVVIPNSVTYIGYCAFSNCTRLVDVTIPQSVTRIDKYAFLGCDNLKNIIFENPTQWTATLYKEQDEEDAYERCNKEVATIDVTNPTVVAELLTSKYADCQWEKE